MILFFHHSILEGHMIQKGRDTARQDSSTAQKERQGQKIENSLKNNKTWHQRMNNVIPSTLQHFRHILNA